MTGVNISGFAVIPASGCDLESVALDGSDRRVEDPTDCDNILLEFFE